MVCLTPLIFDALSPFLSSVRCRFLLYPPPRPSRVQNAAWKTLQRKPVADPQEGLGWYLLGRCYMAAHKHELAYAAYEQAV